MKHILKILFHLLICICANWLNAQIRFDQRVDTLEMLIGDQQHLSMTSSDSLGEDPFEILDTLSWLHIIDKGNWIPKDQYFERKVLFTVFDSGYFKIPSLGVMPLMDSNLILGNPISLAVAYPQDSLNILRPIKSIEETKTPFKYFYVILGVLFIICMLFVLWQFFRADRIKPAFIEIPKEQKIWEQCLQSLEDLESKKLWPHSKVKEYYDELSFILRNFLSSGLKIPALENTSSEIIEFIQHNKVEIQDDKKLHDCFLESDFVKFANLIPPEDRNASWMSFAKDFVFSHKELSEAILEETRMHWLALLGTESSRQFENPLETVPKELIQLYTESTTGKLELLHNMISKSTFLLPLPWIKWHEMHTGIFYRWHYNTLSISKHKVIQVIMLILILPFITLFLPFMFITSVVKKQNLFSHGVFGLSRNNKLVLRRNI